MYFRSRDIQHVNILPSILFDKSAWLLQIEASFPRQNSILQFIKKSPFLESVLLL